MAKTVSISNKESPSNKDNPKNTIAELCSAVGFDLKWEIQRLEDHTRRDLQIIGLYLSQRKPDIRTPAQLREAILRHLRAAKALKPFEDDQIIKGFKKAASQTSEWTIETAVKMVTK